MKKSVSLLLFFCAVVFSCKKDDDAPAPAKPVDITLDDKATEFTDFKATDVGNGIDIDLKNTDMSIAIRLEGKTSTKYDFANLSGENDFSINNSVVVVTSLSGTPKVSRSGNIDLTVENGKLSGTIIVDMLDPLLPDSASMVIQGTLSNIDIAAQPDLPCQVEKISMGNVDVGYRYDIDGKITEERKMENGTVSLRRIFSYLNGITVQVIEVGESIYNIYLMEYNGSKLTRIRSVSDNEMLTSFSYNGVGQISKITTSKKGDPSTSVCLTYHDGNAGSQGDCANPENVQITFVAFDDKLSPYSSIQSALGGQAGMLYLLYPFTGYFSPHNVSEYVEDNTETSITYQYNDMGYPVEASSVNGTTTFTYRNCN